MYNDYHQLRLEFLWRFSALRHSDCEENKKTPTLPNVPNDWFCKNFEVISKLLSFQLKLAR
jgi:hypothetical protein